MTDGPAARSLEHKAPAPAVDTSPRDRRRPHRLVTDPWLITCLVGLAAFSVVFVWRASFTQHGAIRFSLFDDAMISMRYARNLATGHGLAWNQHGPRVEGYTNTLWTLWMAVLHLPRLGDAKTGVLVIASSAALLLGNVVVVRAVAQRLAPDSRLVVIAATVLTATYYPLAYWALRGMEVGLLAFLLSSGVLFALRLRDRHSTRDLACLAVVMGAMILVREDALVPCALLTLYAIWSARREHRATVAVTTIATIVGVTVALTVFRLAYYGDLLPNTYYLKMTGVATHTRIATGLRAFRQISVVHLFAMFAVALPAVARFRRTRDPALGLLAALFAAQCVYSIYVGGDAWETFSYSNRYICIAVPMLFVLSAFGIDEMCRGSRERSARLLGIVLAGLGVSAFALRLWGAASTRFPAPDAATIAGLHRYDGLLVVGGAAAMVAGALLWLPGAQDGPAARIRQAVGDAVTARPALSVAVACVFVVVVTNVMAVTDWYRHNGHSVDLDNSLAIAGAVERNATAPDTTIAVWFAGNSAYFSHRYSIDLLGKSDAKIAHLPSTGPFIPGHSKHDFTYSIRTLRPDVVDFGPTPFALSAQQKRLYATWGYRAVGPALLVRADERHINAAALGRLYTGQRLQR